MNNLGQHMYVESLEDIMARRQAISGRPAGWTQGAWDRSESFRKRGEAEAQFRGEGPVGGGWSPGYGGAAVYGAQDWYLKQQTPMAEDFDSGFSQGTARGSADIDSGFSQGPIGPGPEGGRQGAVPSTRGWADAMYPASPKSAFPHSRKEIASKLRVVPGGRGAPASYGPLGPPATKAAGRTWRQPVFSPSVRGFGLSGMGGRFIPGWQGGAGTSAAGSYVTGAEQEKQLRDERKKQAQQLIMLPPESFADLQAIAWMRGSGPYPGQPVTPLYREPRETPSVYNNPWMASVQAKAQRQLPSISLPSEWSRPVSLRNAFQSYVEQGASPTEAYNALAPYQTASPGYRSASPGYGISAAQYNSLLPNQKKLFAMYGPSASTLRGFGSLNLGTWLRENAAVWASGLGIAYLVWKLAVKKG